MITICPKQTKPDQDKFQLSVHQTSTGSVLFNLLLSSAFKGQGTSKLDLLPFQVEMICRVVLEYRRYS